jgi:protein-tyrosine phosphatase
MRPSTEIEKTGMIRGATRLNPLKDSQSDPTSPEKQAFNLSNIVDEEISEALEEKLKHLMRNFCFLVLSTQKILPKDPTKETSEQDVEKIGLEELLLALKDNASIEPELPAIQNGLDVYTALQSQKIRELYVLGDGLESFVQKYSFLSTATTSGDKPVTADIKKVTVNYPNEIMDQIFLGNILQVKENSILTTLKITHVLNTAEEIEVPLEQLKQIGVHYYKLPIKDYSDFDIKQFFERAYEIMAITLDSDTNHNILVHCARGKCRSVAIVTMYLMKKYQWGFKKTIDFISRKNDSVNLNLGFEEALEQFEKGGFLFSGKLVQ